MRVGEDSGIVLTVVGAIVGKGESYNHVQCQSDSCLFTASVNSARRPLAPTNHNYRHPQPHPTHTYTHSVRFLAATPSRSLVGTDNTTLSGKNSALKAPGCCSTNPFVSPSLISFHYLCQPEGWERNPQCV